MTVATATLHRGRALPALEVLGEVLLGWGALSSLLYVGADLLAAVRYPGYSCVSWTISELSAIGAPTRPLAVALGIAYDVLVIGFGVGVWESARGKRALRITGALLIAYGAIGLAAPFFPMHLRGAQTSLTDAMHIALTAVTVLLILLQLAIGSAASGKGFRVFSLATLVVVLVFGALAGWDGPRIAAGEPTPWVGVIERTCVGAYLLWVAVLDVVLLQAETRAVSMAATPGGSAARRGRA
jgi:hypothetical protein